MNDLLNKPLVRLGITAAVIYAAWRWGSPEVKGAALGVAGFIALNQVPVVRDGMGVRVINGAAA